MEKYTVENKGIITLGDKVMVSDPCYGLNTWCQGIVENVLPGKYECKVGFSDEGRWGIRVADIEVTHVDYVDDFLEYHSEPFEVGVDSGQAGIFDYEYYKKYHKDRSEAEHIDEDWYDRVYELTHPYAFDGNPIDGFGLVSSSGYGDGCYICWTAKNAEGEVVAIQVEYLGDDDEEDI